MTVPTKNFFRNEVRRVRGEKFVCTLNRFLPLGRKYHPLLKLLNGRQGLLAVPFGPYHVIKPAVWIKSITTQLVLGQDTVAEFEVLKPLCQQCKTGHLIDVGANLGLYTLFFRSASRLPIIAYEPQPFLFKLLQWNIAYNRLPDIETRNLACGARRGNVAFLTGLNGSIVPETSMKARDPGDAMAAPGSGWETEARMTLSGGRMHVPVTTLDEDLANLDRIALLKIDCEGFEHQILQGAKTLLRRHRPFLFIEVHPEQLVDFGNSTQELLDLLSPDYELEFWYFQLGRHASKLGRSLGKFRRPKGHRCADAVEMLDASTRVPGPAQIYFVGRPRR